MLGAAAIARWLPETRGRSLEEVEGLFAPPKVAAAAAKAVEEAASGAASVESGSERSLLPGREAADALARPSSASRRVLARSAARYASAVWDAHVYFPDGARIQHM